MKSTTRPGWLYVELLPTTTAAARRKLKRLCFHKPHPRSTIFTLAHVESPEAGMNLLKSVTGLHANWQWVSSAQRNLDGGTTHND